MKIITKMLAKVNGTHYLWGIIKLKTSDMKTLNELQKEGYTLHHSSSCRGYISANQFDPRICAYSGKFGEGFTAEYSNTIGFLGRDGKRHFSNNYHLIQYWTK